MEPHEDAIETSTATIWLEDGIIVSRANGQPTDLGAVQEGFLAIGGLTQGVRRPFLMDAREWPGADLQSFSEGAARLSSTFSAMAILIDPATPPDIGSFLDAINRLLLPIELFTDEDEALAFLRGFLPSE